MSGIQAMLLASGGFASRAGGTAVGVSISTAISGGLLGVDASGILYAQITDPAGAGTLNIPDSSVSPYISVRCVYISGLVPDGDAQGTWLDIGGAGQLWYRNTTSGAPPQDARCTFNLEFSLNPSGSASAQMVAGPFVVGGTKTSP